MTYKHERITSFEPIPKIGLAEMSYASALRIIRAELQHGVLDGTFLCPIGSNRIEKFGMRNMKAATPAADHIEFSANFNCYVAASSSHRIANFRALDIPIPTRFWIRQAYTADSTNRIFMTLVNFASFDYDFASMHCGLRYRHRSQAPYYKSRSKRKGTRRWETKKRNAPQKACSTPVCASVCFISFIHSLASLKAAMYWVNWATNIEHATRKSIHRTFVEFIFISH